MQGGIFALLERLEGEQALIECSIATAESVKVTDVAGGSQAFFDRYGFATSHPQAPEICVEIRSLGNTMEKMIGKSQLYLACGALEVWVIGERGGVHFFTAQGEAAASNDGLDAVSVLGH